MRWLPLLALGLLGCSGPSPKEIGLAALLSLPAGWLAFGLLLHVLGLLLERWRSPSWHGWWVGLAVLVVAAAVLGALAPGIDWGLVPLGLLSVVPSMVAWSLLLWRLLMWSRTRSPVGLNWLAPLVVTALWAGTAGSMLQGSHNDFALAVWIYTGFFWAGPAVVMVGLSIEGTIRRNAAKPAVESV